MHLNGNSTCLRGAIEDRYGPLLSPMTLTSDFDVALNKRNAGQGSVFCVWLFSCNDSMSLAGRKLLLRLNVIHQIRSYVYRKESQFQYSSNFG